MTFQTHRFVSLLVVSTLAGVAGVAGARDVPIHLPDLFSVPSHSAGPWIAVGEQWGDFFDVCVGQAGILDSSGNVVSPTLQNRTELYSRLAEESASVREIPNSVVRVDFLWKGIESVGEGYVSYERTDFTTEFALRQLGSQVVGLLAAPPPDWIEPFVYDAEAGVTLEQYKATLRPSVDGIMRTGEDRLDAWERYVAAVVGRYADRVEIWQVLIEPNSFLFSEENFTRSGMTENRAKANADRFGELFDDFVFELIQRASRVIRALDPTARIASLGLIDANIEETPSQSRVLLNRLIQRGLANEVDLVSLHSFVQQWPSSPDEAANLDHFLAPDAAIALASGTDLRFMSDEWGHTTVTRTEELDLPQHILRFVAENLGEGVSPLLFFEAYNWMVFPRDLGNVKDYYLLDSLYPYSPKKTPGYSAFQEIVRLLAGAVPEKAINQNAPQSTGSEYPDNYVFDGYSYRSFTNGLDRVVAFWSNTSVGLNPVISNSFASQARAIIFRSDGTVETNVFPGEVNKVDFSASGIQPLGRFESALIYFCRDPQATIQITGLEDPVIEGAPVQLGARGPNGEQLAPTWRVVQGTGMGAISPTGSFKGLRGGACVVVADVGIHSASREVQIVDLSENLLANASVDVIWSGTAGCAAPPWRRTPPATVAASAGATVSIATGSDAFLGNGFIHLNYPPTIGVDRDSNLIKTWFPGYVSQNIVSGLSALGPRLFDADEPLLFFCWGRRPKGYDSDRYLYMHIALFDRFRNPQNEHKLADIRMGGRFAPGEDWTFISSLIQVGAPGMSSDGYIDNNLIFFPENVEQFDVIFEIDNRFESQPTVADVDGIYLGPYKPLILIHPDIPTDQVELAWFVDRRMNPGATVNLYLDVDLDPDNGNEYELATDLDVNFTQPFRKAVADLPAQFRGSAPVFAYAVSAHAGIIDATDYAGPLLLQSNSSVSQGVKGDANGNGKIDIGDAMAIAQLLGGLRDHLPAEDLADINGNGKIDIGDALFITQILGGLKDDPN